MYFSGLRKLISSAEEKNFYDVCIMYLSAQRYRELSVVDGTGDGGRDVTCSRRDLRIQLSVRKDWNNKINEEAKNALDAGKRHLIYVTNRPISPKAEEAFRAAQYRYAGRVDVSIHDLNRIATALARPGRIKRAYELMGATVTPTVHASPTEIAISSLLLFGQEASELREEIVDANVRAWLLRHPRCREDELIDEVVRILPGASPVKAVISAVSRLRTSGKIVGQSNEVSLSSSEFSKMKAAEDEFLLAKETDILSIMNETSLPRDDSSKLLDLATEILLSGRDFSAGDADAENIQRFLAEKGISRQRSRIYDTLSRCTIARHFQYSQTIDHIFSTNTFDIHRALGGHTDIKMVLDTSVALPMLFGLEYQAATSRYAVGASTLLEVCRAHEIPIMVPRPYVNEMAAHGIRAIEFLEKYESLPENLKPFLRGSGNAYLSHYSHIQEAMTKSGFELSLSEFLSKFGIRKDVPIRRAENRIISALESHGILIGMTSYYDSDVRNEISEAKPQESKHIIDHDAAVCTNLINDSSHGYILATWDKVLIKIVQDLARVYADSPARVTDFLSSIEGIDYDYDRSAELLTTLLHVDERQVEKLARKIETIQTPSQAHRLSLYIEQARSESGDSWLPDVDDLSHFLDSSSPDETSAVVGDL